MRHQFRILQDLYESPLWWMQHSCCSNYLFSVYLSIYPSIYLSTPWLTWVSAVIGAFITTCLIMFTKWNIWFTAFCSLWLAVCQTCQASKDELFQCRSFEAVPTPIHLVTQWDTVECLKGRGYQNQTFLGVVYMRVYGLPNELSYFDNFCTC